MNKGFVLRSNADTAHVFTCICICSEKLSVYSNYLYGWIKNGHIRKNLTKNCEPQRYSWGTQKKKKKRSIYRNNIMIMIMIMIIIKIIISFIIINCPSSGTTLQGMVAWTEKAIPALPFKPASLCLCTGTHFCTS